MFQVGDLIRCPIDGEFGLIIEKKLFKFYDCGTQHWYKIVWQGSELRSELHDPKIEWSSPREILSIEDYDRTQKGKKNS